MILTVPKIYRPERDSLVPDEPDWFDDVEENLRYDGVTELPDGFASRLDFTWVDGLVRATSTPESAIELHKSYAEFVSTILPPGTDIRIIDVKESPLEDLREGYSLLIKTPKLKTFDDVPTEDKQAFYTAVKEKTEKFRECLTSDGYDCVFENFRGVYHPASTILNWGVLDGEAYLFDREGIALKPEHFQRPDEIITFDWDSARRIRYSCPGSGP